MTAKGGAKSMRTRFRRILLVGFLSVFTPSAFAPAIGGEPKKIRIKVRVWDTVHLTTPTLEQAKAITERIYEQAGIEMTWSHCTAEPKPENFICANPAGPNDIALRVYGSASEMLPKTGHFTGGAAIPTMPGGTSGIALLFCDRLERAAKDGKIPLEVVLGITMAHEIGHLVISPGHAVEGIMRRRLTHGNWLLACRGKLRFHPMEVQTMRKRVLVLAPDDSLRTPGSRME
jgi:hypothetical protein